MGSGASYLKLPMFFDSFRVSRPGGPVERRPVDARITSAVTEEKVLDDGAPLRRVDICKAFVQADI